MTFDKRLAALCIAAGAVAATHAADVGLPADGQWNPFTVDALLAAPAAPLAWIDDVGDPLAFVFTIAGGAAGSLTVVDAAIAGDTFRVVGNGVLLGSTSAVAPGSFEAGVDAGLDFDAALADARFSRGVFALGAGSYRVSGVLAQSVTFGGAALDATAGAVRLTVSAVPEPGIFALLLAGLGAIGIVLRRRNPSDHRSFT